MLPSLVTWPTIRTAVPVDLAKRTSAAVHSRSCCGEPGLASAAADCMVWMESMTSRAARLAVAIAVIASSWLSQQSTSWPAPSPRRAARCATWPVDSSPEA